MKTTPFQPQLATLHDYPAIISLIEEAACWLHDKGIDQWVEPWPSQEQREERIRKSLAAGTTWIVWDGSTAMATITVERYGSKRLWSPVELCQRAVYAHRLVVSRAYAGKRIGAYLLDWAANRGAAYYGAREIRIDVWTTNKALHAYYEAIGFTFVRMADKYADDNWGCPSLALFRRPIGDAARPGMRRRTPKVAAWTGPRR
jgi:ribosomal protein S18 acetylase RimI-like enzyme